MAEAVRAAMRELAEKRVIGHVGPRTGSHVLERELQRDRNGRRSTSSAVSEPARTASTR
jgi:hypothetical protein